MKIRAILAATLLLILAIHASATGCNPGRPLASTQAETVKELPIMTSTQAAAPADRFPSEAAGLPDAVPSKTVELRDGDQYELVIAPVRKRVGDTWVRLRRHEPLPYQLGGSLR